LAHEHTVTTARGPDGRMREMAGWLLCGQEIPLVVKAPYLLFVAVLVPVYWRHWGPANFLWFSDLALFCGLAAAWLESPLLAGMATLAVAALEFVWIADFLVRLVAGVRLVGMADYMFEPEKPLYVRGLSLFHLVLPFLLLWLVYRLGYDRRALVAQTVLAWAVLLACYRFTDRSENINWVFGPGRRPQSRMAPGLYLALLMAFFPGCIYLPTHLVLRAVPPWAFTQ
jgi:hypothetical protein